ncbi:MAG: amidohydrolase family protein [Nitrospirota bacterium]
MILSAEIILPISRQPVYNGAILIKNGKIEDIDTKERLLNKYKDEEHLNLKESVLMPGLINLHTHLELTALKGSIIDKNNPAIPSEKIDLVSWILALIESKKRSSGNELSSGIKIGIKEVVSTGTTTIADLTTRNTIYSTSVFGESFYAIKEAKLRAFVFVEVLNFDSSAAVTYWKDTQKVIEQIRKDEDSLTSIGIAPHSIYSVSSKLLKIVRDYAVKEKIKMSMHVAESMEEKEFVSKNKGIIKDIYHKKFNWYGKRDFKRYPTSIEYIDKNGLLSKDLLAVHCVHLTDEDIKRLSGNNTPVVLCPRSNTLIGVGIASFDKLASKSITIGIGTDSLASNYSLNMWDEMRFAYLFYRKTSRTNIKAEDIIKCGTINGAKALSINNKIGTLDIGKEADLIAVRLHKKDIDIYRDLLLNTKPDDVLMTMVAGKIIHSSGIEGLKNVN